MLVILKSPNNSTGPKAFRQEQSQVLIRNNVIVFSAEHCQMLSHIQNKGHC